MLRSSPAELSQVGCVNRTTLREVGHGENRAIRLLETAFFNCGENRQRPYVGGKDNSGGTVPAQVSDGVGGEVWLRKRRTRSDAPLYRGTEAVVSTSIPLTLSY